MSSPVRSYFRRASVTAVAALLLGSPPPIVAAPTALTPQARELVLTSTRLADQNWDERAGFLWNGTSRKSHGVRATSWYILGLMVRDAPGDRDRALAALHAVLAQQIDEPDAAWHGTFYRTPEEPQPRHDAKMWDDYDPNWREFIGSALALLLIEYEDRVPAADRARIDASLTRAVEGELRQGRLVPTYTNIALMHGFLQGYAGQRLHRDDWVRASEAWLESVYTAFAPHESFEEFNSPTYYGVDLYGLALLRRHGSTPRLRELGATMEAALWNDIARFYHAGLRNLAGPFDRTYGMDMPHYVSLTGVWLRLALPAAEAPLPAPGPVMDHGNDFNFTPCFALLGIEIPASAASHFSRFTGERQLTRPIGDGRRVATAWLDRDIMIGAESTSLSRDTRGPTAQFRPATIHWRSRENEVGWIALVQSPRVNARASRNRLAIHAIGDNTLRIAVPSGVEPAQITRERWNLPGLVVHVESDARDFTLKPGADFVDVSYLGATQITLRTQLNPVP
jgi:hypothetical protein